eukprot:g6263.t1
MGADVVGAEETAGWGTAVFPFQAYNAFVMELR